MNATWKASAILGMILGSVVAASVIARTLTLYPPLGWKWSMNLGLGGALLAACLATGVAIARGRGGY